MKRGRRERSTTAGRRRSREERQVASAIVSRTTAREGCSRETDAQAAQETRLRTRCAGDGQAALLRRGNVRNGMARHEQGLRKNNRAENSHQPTRRREHKMQRFKSPGSAQRLLSIHAAVHNTFNVQRHLTSRRTLRVLRDEAFRTWRTATAA